MGVQLIYDDLSKENENNGKIQNNGGKIKQNSIYKS
jgi:hypothetical protein